MSIIRASNLTFTYAGAPRSSVEDVSLEVSPGEFVVLTGPSGCGKTTVCRCLNGLIPNFYSGDFTGELVVDGMNVKEHTTAELSSHVGLVFQNPENQLFSLSIERDVAFGPENLGLSREETRRRVDWALEVTGITDLKDRPPYELSGGQQQRAAIAAVLAMQPKIIVLDEPTSFLDPKSALEILAVISDLNKKLGITIILVEHRLDLASKHANRVIVMDSGKIVLDGTPKQVYGEQARLIGIGVPRVITLFNLLQKGGLEFSQTPTTVEEAAQELRKMLSR
ncbi:ATP-binding cassette domain-containing protein [Candidatus Bathyarchaeota archaeon]|nr:ATP-binding cassette domain-containing protein [Candidatus Bathyarchaeota archaeon]